MKIIFSMCIASVIGYLVTSIANQNIPLGIGFLAFIIIYYNGLEHLK